MRLWLPEIRIRLDPIVRNIAHGGTESEQVMLAEFDGCRQQFEDGLYRLVVIQFRQRNAGVFFPKLGIGLILDGGRLQRRSRGAHAQSPFQ